MLDPNNPQPVPDPTTPEALAADLRRLHHAETPIEIPAGVDARVAQLARWHLSRAHATEIAEQAKEPRGPIHIGTVRTSPARLRRYAGVRWIAFSSAAAAVLITAVAVWPIFRGSSGAGSPNTAGSASSPLVLEAHKVPATTLAALEDINNDGVIDILDSQRLTFLIHDQPAVVKREWDFSADGTVDDEDAKVIARHVVVRKDGGAG